MVAHRGAKRCEAGIHRVPGVKLTGTYRMATPPTMADALPMAGALIDRAEPADLGQRLSARIIRRQGRFGPAFQPARRLGTG